MIHKLLKKRKLIASILAMALPAIIEMALNTTLGVADTIMISRFVGKDGLSAVGFSNGILFPLIFIFTSFNTGATALISRSYGEKNFERLNRVGSQTVLLNGLIGLVIMILSLTFSRSLFSIFDTTPAVTNMIQIYFSIVCYGMLAMFFSFSFASVLRGAGDTLSPMIITGIANLLNIIGNYVLIKGVWIFPSMGIAGAALSTTISRIIAVLIYVVICFWKHNRVKLKISYMGFQSDILRPLLKISGPGAMEQTLMQTSFIAISVIVSQLETVAEAAFRILITIESMSFMPAVGISIASATLVGKALGEKNPDLAVETGSIAYGLSILWGLIAGTAFLLFKRPFLLAFTTEASVIEACLFAMTLIAFNQPLLNFMITISGALRGAGDTKAVMVISILRNWIIFVPFSYVFSISLNGGLSGIWVAEILSYVLFGFVILKRFHSKKWTKINL